jgi:hypothetical protein
MDMMMKDGTRVPGNRIVPDAGRKGNLGKLDSMGLSEFHRLAPLEQERLLVGARLEKILPNLGKMPCIGNDGKSLREKARSELGDKVNAVNAGTWDDELKEKVFHDLRAKEARMREVHEKMLALAGKTGQEGALPPEKTLAALCRLSALAEEKQVLTEQVEILGNAWRDLNGQNRRLNYCVGSQY